MSLSTTQIAELRAAKTLLENPGLAARITNAVGSPIERGFALLPKKWATVVGDATRKSIETALDVALWSMDQTGAPHPPSNWWHKLAVGASGAAGGAFGLAALAIELPVSTTIILRSIADIARSEGEDLTSPQGKLQCVQVLALGGASKNDDAAETGYFAARAAMAQAVAAASAHLAHKGLSKGGAPALARVIAEVATRFSINVSEKAAAQAIPVVGALGGAMINTLFIDHFQAMGRGHFVVRRLERLHGVDEIRKIYDAL
ncbi:MAG: EcsC family protein [Burkholderiales bacterium]|nr:EcsC family protein [Burkholderiales bacterium]